MHHPSELSVSVDNGSSLFRTTGPASAFMSVKNVVPASSVSIRGGKLEDLFEAGSEAEIQHHVKTFRALEAALLAMLNNQGVGAKVSYKAPFSMERDWELKGDVVEVDPGEFLISDTFNFNNDEVAPAAAATAILKAFLDSRKSAIGTLYRKIRSGVEGRLNTN